MALGDITDFAGRLRAVLPGGWFPSLGRPQPVSAALLTESGVRLLTEGGVPLQTEAPAVTVPSPTPVLDAVLGGLGSVWASLYSLLGYVQAQTRIATSFGAFLDFISTDFFGTGLQRLPNEQDGAFRARIEANLFLPQGTRAAMIAKLIAVTGKAPWIFEPQRPADTGSYGAAGTRTWGGLAYGFAGGYGDMQLPGQCFVIAHRPAIPGIPNAAGYGTLTSGSVSSPLGGYGNGTTRLATSPRIEYGSRTTATGAWTDNLIYEAVAATEQAGVIAWTQIEN